MSIESIKTELKIKLYAGDTLVAESDNAKLWQATLATISGARDVLPIPAAPVAPEASEALSDRPSGPAVRWAAELELSPAIVEDACAPRVEPPFIVLDKHHFESFAKNTPNRGSKSVPNVTLAATLLVLWFHAAKLDQKPGLEEVRGVLKSLSLPSNNASRSLGNCEWLQYRDGNLSLKASQTSKAIAVARAYCSQEQLRLTDG